jgi:fructose-1,6-bisphosphatase/inositol monophosphatase family enzyme
MRSISVYGFGMNISLPYSPVFSETIELMTKAVLESSRYLDAAHRSKATLDIQVKSDNSLVLNLDLESQRLILQNLGGALPIVAEEDPASHSLIDSEPSYFSVDPLDGTTTCKRFLGQYGGQVGFGPLIGFVSQGRLTAASFYSIPQQKLFTAVRGEGAHVTCFDHNWRVVEHARKLVVAPCPDLSKAGMLFFVSPYGEPAIVEFLKRKSAVENVYRFGGFASDSTRLAQDFEQIQLQLYAKPWDFPAVLFASEAGCDVFCDPLKRRVPLSEWTSESNNPIVVVPAGAGDAFFTLIDQMK